MSLNGKKKDTSLKGSKDLFAHQANGGSFQIIGGKKRLFRRGTAPQREIYKTEGMTVLGESAQEGGERFAGIKREESSSKRNLQGFAPKQKKRTRYGVKGGAGVQGGVSRLGQGERTLLLAKGRKMRRRKSAQKRGTGTEGGLRQTAGKARTPISERAKKGERENPRGFVATNETEEDFHRERKREFCNSNLKKREKRGDREKNV